MQYCWQLAIFDLCSELRLTIGCYLMAGASRSEFCFSTCFVTVTVFTSGTRSEMG